MTAVALYLLLIFLLFVSVALTALTLPGTWLILLFVALYGWLTHWTFVTLTPLIVLFVLATIAEVIDFVAAGAGAKKAGAGRPGSIGAVVGGFLGAIGLSFLIPIPFVGTILGMLAGCFLGAAGLEILFGRDPTHSFRIGAAATKGRFVGALIKVMFAMAMFAVALYAAFPHSRSAPKATLLPPPTTVPASTTAPTTVPATTTVASFPTTLPTTIP